MYPLYFFSQPIYKNMKQAYMLLGCIALPFALFAEQKPIQRIEKMPDMPQPYEMRDWKSVTRSYDNFVFDTQKSGDYLPLIQVRESGHNYTDVPQIRLDTYVGTNAHNDQAEAINIMPAIIGATLVDIDKSAQNGHNWVRYAKDFFNRRNGQNVYLNNYSAASGGDWWYDLMPNVYFYQLYDLYPQIDPDFDEQFVTVADRWLDAIYKLGGNPNSWTLPDINYRAFNLATGKPLVNPAVEPESAGTIAWLLLHAYRKTGDVKYYTGAQLAMEALCNFPENPSYELQLPYGTLTAARMNAELNCNYDIDKLLNWCFDRARVRGWGAIVGTWGGYDVSGLIGEANDRGNDYAFVMNGFQQVAALAPVVKYDKRYARALGKWILNIANASRLFYNNVLPANLQEPNSCEWSGRYDTESCLPYESMKEKWNGNSPYIMGDAVNGKWAATNISLYSGSSVGYLAAVVEKSDVEKILQIDVNRTDFYADNAFPTYLYYNPYEEAKSVSLALPDGAYDLYDAISEQVIAANVSGKSTITIPADGVVLVSLLPAGCERKPEGRLLKSGDRVIDYHYGYDFTSPIRVKALTADKTQLLTGETVTFRLLTDNTQSPAYSWSINGQTVAGAETAQWQWTAEAEGTYLIEATATENGTTVSESIRIEVFNEMYDAPVITGISASRTFPLFLGETVTLTPTLQSTVPNVSYEWEAASGTLTAEGSDAQWQIPGEAGIYTVRCTASNSFGSNTFSIDLLVKENNPDPILPVIYYPLAGNTENAATPGKFDAVQVGGSFTTDSRGLEDQAFSLTANSQKLYTENDPELGFSDKIVIAAWIRPERKNGVEQFILSHGSWEERYKLSLTPDMKLRWTVKTSNGVKDVDDPYPLQTGLWYHVSAAYTGYSMELYVNGTLFGYAALDGTLGETSKGISYGAKDPSNTEYSFVGRLDEIRIYHDNLTYFEHRIMPRVFDLSSASVEENHAGQPVFIRHDDRQIQIRFTGEPLARIELYTLQGQLVPVDFALDGNQYTAEFHPAAGVYILAVYDRQGHRTVRKLSYAR